MLLFQILFKMSAFAFIQVAIILLISHTGQGAVIQTPEHARVLTRSEDIPVTNSGQAKMIPEHSNKNVLGANNDMTESESSLVDDRMLPDHFGSVQNKNQVTTSVTSDVRRVSASFEVNVAKEDADKNVAKDNGTKNVVYDVKPVDDEKPFIAVNFDDVESEVVDSKNDSNASSRVMSTATSSTRLTARATTQTTTTSTMTTTSQTSSPTFVIKQVSMNTRAANDQRPGANLIQISE